MRIFFWLKMKRPLFQMTRPITAVLAAVPPAAADKTNQREWAWKFTTINMTGFLAAQAAETVKVRDAESCDVVCFWAGRFRMRVRGANCTVGGLPFWASSAKMTKLETLGAPLALADVVLLADKADNAERLPTRQPPLLPGGDFAAHQNP